MKNTETKDWDDFKVGDKVYSIVHGEGEVTATDCGGFYPVEVNFDGCDLVENYTRDGFLFKGYGSRSLFFSPPEIIPGVVKRPFKSKLVGKSVLVRYKAAKLFDDEGVITDETENYIVLGNVNTISKSAISSIQEIGEPLEF